MQRYPLNDIGQKKSSPILTTSVNQAQLDTTQMQILCEQISMHE